MNIFWPASFVKFPLRYWTEFSQSWKDFRKRLPSWKPSIIDRSKLSYYWFSLKFKNLVILNVHDVRSQSINEQKRAVLARLCKPYSLSSWKIVEIGLQSMNMSLLQMYRVYLPLPVLYRQCCADLIKCNVDHQKWSR